MFKKALIIGMICLSVGSVSFAKVRSGNPGSISPVSSSNK